MKNKATTLRAILSSFPLGTTFRITGNVMSFYDKDGKALADVCVTPDGELYVERHTS